MPSTPFRFAASLSTLDDTAAAVNEACSQVSRNLDGPATFAIVLFSQHHVEQAETPAKFAKP
jgi:hypothetical protein